MNVKRSNPGEEQDNLASVFDQSLGAWLDYTASPGGRLRHDLALAHLVARLPQQPCRILDAGCGTGELAAALAGRGHRVVALDFSTITLAEAQRRCQAAGPSADDSPAQIDFIRADAAHVESIFGPDSFAAIACHSLLEFSEDPLRLLHPLVAVLRRGGVLSVVVGNRQHWPLREALLRHDVGAALAALDHESPGCDLFGLPRRTFEAEEMHRLLAACGLAVAAEYGVRIFADLLSRQVPYDDLLALEQAAAPRLPYRRIARFIQFIAIKGAQA